MYKKTTKITASWRVSVVSRRRRRNVINGQSAGGPSSHNAPNALRPIDRGQWRAMQNTPPCLTRPETRPPSLFFGALFADRHYAYKYTRRVQ